MLCDRLIVCLIVVGFRLWFVIVKWKCIFVNIFGFLFVCLVFSVIE